jgi:hypothetical protein
VVAHVRQRPPHLRRHICVTQVVRGVTYV